MNHLNQALADVQQQLHADKGESKQLLPALSPPSKRPPASQADSDEEEEEQAGGGGGGHDDHAPIQVFCRIRPSRRGGSAAPKSVLSVDPEEKRVEFHLAKTQQAGTVNNSREQFKFQFNGLFEGHTTQEQIFDGIGKRVCDNVIAGYNGTIFAYGQTGSGKTFSMVGGTNSFEDRGLIPRSLSYIFEWIEEHAAEYSVQVRISFLEVYNDKGYDLLDPQHENKSLEDLPRVTLLEGDRGQIYFRNLGELPAANIDEALNLLFVGDTNRVVCETPSNDASTRSHCIFMISLETRELATSKIRRSKLNLVDLAGSERVKKTGVGGKILNEALHINVSLHYLEQVIVSLHEASQGKSVHIPYRNSLLTSVLRDSLGGNCKTVMLATCSPELAHLDESISTSRFAQRVAMIRNKAQLNEEVDPYVLVKRLKSQLREMKQELAAARGASLSSFRPLDDDDLERVREFVRAFIANDRDPTRFDEDGTHTFQAIPMANPYRVRACFDVWKEILMQTQKAAAAHGAMTPALPAPIAAAAPTPAVPENVSAHAMLELTRLQRENRALIDALQRGVGSEHAAAVVADIRRQMKQGVGGESVPPPQQQRRERDRQRGGEGTASDPRPSSSTPSSHAPSSSPPPPVSSKPAPSPEEVALARRRAEAFESFRRSYRKHTMVEEQKATHARKVEEARATGEAINSIRNDINTLKGKIETRRLQRGMAALGEAAAGTDPAALPPDEEELQMRARIDQLKLSYRSQFESLKRLKQEIDFLKNVVEKARLQLQADFERWWEMQQNAAHKQTEEQQQAAAAEAGSQRAQDRVEQRSSRGAREEQRTPRLISESAAVASVGPPPSSAYSSSSSSSSSRSRPADVARPPSASSRSSVSSSFSSSSAAPSRSSVPAAPRNAWNDSSATGSAAPVPSNSLPVGLRTTGNSAADADIARFYELKQQMLRQRQQQQQQ